MAEIKCFFAPRCRPLTSCAPAVILLLSACAALESEDSAAHEADDAKPVVFAVALADDPVNQDPSGHPVPVSVSDAPAHSEAAAQAPADSASDAQSIASVPVETVTQGGNEVVATSTTAPTTAGSPPGNSQPANDPIQNPPATTDSQPSPGGTSPQSNDAVRKEVFGLATSGGAVRALD